MDLFGRTHDTTQIAVSPKSDNESPLQCMLNMLVEWQPGSFHDRVSSTGISLSAMLAGRLVPTGECKFHACQFNHHFDSARLVSLCEKVIIWRLFCYPNTVCLAQYRILNVSIAVGDCQFDVRTTMHAWASPRWTCTLLMHSPTLIRCA